MIYETKKYVETLIRLDITPTQFLIAWLIYNKQYALLQQYIDKFGVFERSEIEDLVKKDIILQTRKESMSIVDMVVTLKFADEMLIDDDDAWEELFKVYPSFLLIEGKRISAKALTMQDEKLCQDRYAQVLNKNKYLHREIIDLVNQWKNENGGFATMKIDKFLTSRFWEEIAKGRRGGNSVGQSFY